MENETETENKKKSCYTHTKSHWKKKQHAARAIDVTVNGLVGHGIKRREYVRNIANI